MMTIPRITNLTCEYLVNPVGLDTRAPRFTWQIITDKKQTLQSAYHIQVSDVANCFNASHLQWDSGVVQSSQSVLVVYQGEELRSRQRYYYRINAWDQNGLEMGWSRTASGRWACFRNGIGLLSGLRLMPLLLIRKIKQLFI
ncbi:hypothetical protein [Paenibacillus ferrarius]|uniref:glycoside hydrolase family 78 protein n=1 Tax=Paenibacillus ferrarius TaxID=1469647 RepID=UPI001FCA0C74|nr:hypothetical protein [Paenibacillus ferrarius]